MNISTEAWGLTAILLFMFGFGYFLGWKDRKDKKKHKHGNDC